MRAPPYLGLGAAEPREEGISWQPLGTKFMPPTMVLESEQGAHSAQHRAGGGRGGSWVDVSLHGWSRATTPIQSSPLIPLQSSLEINPPDFSAAPPILTLAQDTLCFLGQRGSSALPLNLETSSPSLVKSLSHSANIYCGHSLKLAM